MFTLSIIFVFILVVLNALTSTAIDPSTVFYAILDLGSVVGLISYLNFRVIILVYILLAFLIPPSSIVDLYVVLYVIFGLGSVVGLISCFSFRIVPISGTQPAFTKHLLSEMRQLLFFDLMEIVLRVTLGSYILIRLFEYSAM